MNSDYRERYSQMKKNLGMEELSPYNSVKELELDIIAYQEGLIDNPQKVSFINSELPGLIRIVLERSYSILEYKCYSFINNFLIKVLQLCLAKLLQNSLWALEVLTELLNPRKRYYDKFCTPIPTTDQSELMQAHNVVLADYVKMYQGNIYFIIILKEFKEGEGFNRIREIISARPGLKSLFLVVDIAINLKDPLTYEHWQQLMKPAWKVAVATLKSLNSEELKLLRKDDLKNYLKRLSLLLELGYSNSKASRIIENCELDIALLQLNSQYLDKKILGIEEINRKISQVQEHKNEASLRYLTKEILLEWIDSHHIFDQIFGSTYHPEIVKKGQIFTKFLYTNSRLSQEMIINMWENALSRHQAYRESFLWLLEELIKILNSDDLQTLFAIMTSVNYSQIDSQMLFVIKSFTFINSRNSSLKVHPLGSEATTAPAKIAQIVFDSQQVLLYLWDLWQEEAISQGMQLEIAGKAMNILKESLCWRCKDKRIDFIQKTLGNIERNRCMAWSCELLQSLLDSFNMNSAPGTESRCSIIGLFYSEIISALLKSFILRKKQLVDLISSYSCIDLGSSLSDLHSEQQQMLESVVNESVFCREEGKTYLNEIRIKLDFLKYIYRQSAEFFSIKHLQVIWKVLVLEAVTQGEADTVFQWLTSLIIHSESYALSIENLINIFVGFILVLDPRVYTVGAYKCYERYFLYLNGLYSMLNIQEYQNSFTVSNMELMSIDHLWQIVLSATKQPVFAESSNFLNKLYTRCKISALKAHQSFLSTCLSHISSSIPYISTEIGQVKTSRCITLIKDLINTPDAIPLSINTQTQVQYNEIQVIVKNKTSTKSSSKDTSVENFYSTTTWRTVKEILVEKFNMSAMSVRFLVNKQEVESYKDDMALDEIGVYSNTTIVIRENIGGDLEDFSKVVINIHVLGQLKGIFEDFEDDLLIMALQKTNNSLEDSVMLLTDGELVEKFREQNVRKISQEVKHVEKPQKKNEIAEMIADNDQFFEIIFSVCNKGHDEINDKIWELLSKIPFYKKMHGMVLSEQCADKLKAFLAARNIFQFSYCLQIISSLITSEKKDELMTDFLKVEGFHFLYKRYLKFRKYNLLLSNSINSRCLENLLKIIQAFIERASTSSDLSFNVLLQIISFEELVATTIEIIDLSLESPLPSESLTESALNLLPVLVTHSPLLQPTIFPSQIFEKLIKTTLLQSKHENLKKTITNTIESLVKLSPDRNSQTSAQLTWEIMVSGLPTSANRNCAQFFKLAVSILHEISDIQKDYLGEFISFVVSQEFTEESYQDQALPGYLSLISELLHNFPTESHYQLLTFLYASLFDLEPPPNTLGPHKTYPLIKSTYTRAAAFQVLVALCVQEPSDFCFLLEKLHSHHSPQKLLRFHNTELEPRAAVGYVGLRNFGCTCYMNSLMQQLYMMPPIREGVLTAGFLAGEQDFEGNLLFQLQVMMANLKLSEKQCFEPRGVCDTFRGYDGEPINVRVQQDADEFMNLLFDKLEELVKNTEHEKLLRGNIGGTIVHTIESTEPDLPYLGEREEHFFRVSVDVKNKKNLAEALDLYVQEELLEGDNKYLCEEYNAKVTASKKCLLDNLQNTIIVHLKRFEFNISDMRRIKINERFEFPQLLNLKPWCKPRELPEDYYEYSLAGVVIHSGSADSGHYYSYIKDRHTENWMKFDDRYVETYDIQNLVHDCFGGSNSAIPRDNFEGFENYYNAYILVYERKTPIPVQSIDLENRISFNKTQEIVQKVKNENLEFLQDSILLENSYEVFLRNLHSGFHFVPCSDARFEDSLGEELRLLIGVTETVTNNPGMLGLSWKDLVETQEFKQIQQSIEKIQEEEDINLKMVKIITLYAVELLVRLNKSESFVYWARFLLKYYTSHLPLCLWLLNLLSHNRFLLKLILVECKSKEAKSLFIDILLVALEISSKHEQGFLLDAISTIKPEGLPYIGDPDGLLYPSIIRYTSATTRFLEYYLSELLIEIKNNTNFISEYLAIISTFCSLGKIQQQVLFTLNILHKLFILITPQTNQNHHSINEKIFECIEKVTTQYKSSELAMDVDRSLIDCFDPNTAQYISGNYFLNIVCSHLQYGSTGRLLVELTWNNLRYSLLVINELASQTLEHKYDILKVKVYINVLGNLLMLNDMERVNRIEGFLSLRLEKYGNRGLFEELQMQASNNSTVVVTVILWWSELISDLDVLQCSKRYSHLFNWIKDFSYTQVNMNDSLQNRRILASEFKQAKEKFYDLCSDNLLKTD